ncbi:hypothetical protein GOHSU_36_00180 [Gordonia hirsuta DSM 44140 = NBRC 16056]|uniref:Uncharacterized protein n=1 Tax=Gordonia hirsuta DSM 44140 = NBRC 16056 TaxID=1121927 RepID=L7LAV8_9ACTN|nr:hypothetical protein [Gordonia hirsuta]GAC58275.1 hypothetical protein GOHSU_36_00180 [Gordonia hirsuta DSM 44140 = NBRC 16056]
MATSINRRNRRRRKAGALVAVGASAALMGGVLAPAAPAQAAPLSIGDFGIPGISQACDAGDSTVATAGNGTGTRTADCTQASPWLLAQIGDGLLGLVLPDLANVITLGGMNGALATRGLEVEGDPRFWDPGNKTNIFIPGTATIAGSGYSTAITLLGGESKAKADYIMAGAIALAATGGIANADALFGVSVATAVGRPALLYHSLLFGDIGAPRIENSAKAKSLPMGFAIANSMLTLDEMIDPLYKEGSKYYVDRYRTSAVALGGVAAAFHAVDGSQGAVCTAVYAEARVHADKVGQDGEVKGTQRQNSCTSVLFIFQKQQNVDEYGGNVVYAIKNPFDMNMVSPYGDNIANFIVELQKIIDEVGSDMGLPSVPGPVMELVAGKFVPEFKSDIVRIVMTPDGPKLGSGLGDFFSRIFSEDGIGGLTGGLGNLFNGFSGLFNQTSFSANPAARSVNMPITLADVGADPITAPAMSKTISTSTPAELKSETQGTSTVELSTLSGDTGTDQQQTTKTATPDTTQPELNVSPTETPSTPDPAPVVTETPTAPSPSDQGSDTSNPSSESVNTGSDSGSATASEPELASVG